MFILSFASLVSYYIVTWLLDVLPNVIPPVGPAAIVTTVLSIINTVKQIIEKILTKNGARIMWISMLHVIMFVTNLIPIIGPIISIPLFILTPNVVFSWLAFTTICKRLDLDEYQFDKSPKIFSLEFGKNFGELMTHFKDQVTLGLKSP